MCSRCPRSLLIVFRSRHLSCPASWQSCFSVSPNFRRYHIVWRARAGHRQRDQYHAGNAGSESAFVAAIDFSLRRHFPSCLLAENGAALWPVSARSLSGKRHAANHRERSHTLEPLCRTPFTLHLGVPHLLPLLSALPLGAGSQGSAQSQTLGRGDGDSFSSFGICGE